MNQILKILTFLYIKFSMTTNKDVKEIAHAFQVFYFFIRKNTRFIGGRCHTLQ